MFVLGPLTLGVCVLELVTAVRFWRSGRMRSFSLERGSAAIWVLGIGGGLLALASGISNPDWVHDFWAAQMAMVAVFLCSGLLLCRVWPDDAAFIAGASGADLRSTRRVNTAWLFLGMLLWFALWPLALELAFPGNHVNPHSTGHPVRNLVQLVQWGLGGPVPPFLAEIGPDGVVRAHQNVPREVTVPMGTTLIAAWLWIQFCFIALLGRSIRPARARISIYLMAPLAFGLMWSYGIGGVPLGEKLALDPRYFGPNSARDSGIWQDEGATLASYGGVMLLAAICTAVLALALGVQRFISRRRSVAAVLAVSPRSGATPQQREEDKPLRLSPRSGDAGLEGS
jgi:hypothetical protein